MAYIISENLAGGQPISAVSTTAKHTLLQRVKAVDSSLGQGEFIYAKASVALLAGDVAWIKSTGNAAKISDTNSKSTGLPAVVVTAPAADEYVWMMVWGTTTVRLKPGTEGNTALYINASVGTLSGATLSSQVLGIVAVTSVTTTVGAVTCVLTYPVMLRAASATMT